MTLRLLTPPSALPLSMAEAKAIARLDGQDDDALVAGLIRAATEWVEQYLGRALITSTWEYRPAHFLWPRCSTSIRLPIAPVQSITEIRYLDPTGAEQVLDTEVYLVTGLPYVASIGWAPSAASWPTMAHQPEVLRVTFTAGYGSDHNSVPEAVRLAIGEQVRALYDGCGPSVPEQLLQPYRVVPV